MLLLTADWHLTDNPADEYRWRVFDECRRILATLPNDTELFILGDLCDRKDRHSAKLVNRLVAELGRLIAGGTYITILMGNHDMPLNGPPFWQFLDSCFVGANGASAVAFVTEPLALADLLLLPYTHDPRKMWTTHDFSKYSAIFMHQTVTGVVENGFTLENENMPELPANLTIYSGDIHTPQVVGNVTYVSAPHPVKFGDDYDCRMLLLDDAYKIVKQYDLAPMRKRMIDIQSVADLDKEATNPGDQVCVRLALSLDQVERWPIEEEVITRWAEARQVILTACEASVTATEVPLEGAPADFDLEPAQVLALFADAENMADSLRAAGLALLEELKNA